MYLIHVLFVFIFCSIVNFLTKQFRFCFLYIIYDLRFDKKKKKDPFKRHFSPWMKQFFFSTAMVASSLWWFTLNSMRLIETVACDDDLKLVVRVFVMYSYDALSTHAFFLILFSFLFEFLIRFFCSFVGFLRKYGNTFGLPWLWSFSCSFASLNSMLLTALARQLKKKFKCHFDLHSSLLSIASQIVFTQSNPFQNNASTLCLLPSYDDNMENR